MTEGIARIIEQEKKREARRMAWLAIKEKFFYRMDLIRLEKKRPQSVTAH